MTRIFLPPEQLTSDEIVIDGSNARHLALVMRVKAGDSFEVLDGEGYTYQCTVKKTHKKEIIAQVIEKKLFSVESPVVITLAQGMARGEKMDLIIQKSIELGVHRIIPVVTERSQLRNTHKLERWRKIAISASQQSGRSRIPEILEPIPLTELCNSVNPPSSPFAEDGKGEMLPLILSESCREQHLKHILQTDTDIKQITLLIGPEGGFSQKEINNAVDKGFSEVSLGPRILRTETAPIAAISIIQYELGDMGQDSV